MRRLRFLASAVVVAVATSFGGQWALSAFDGGVSRATAASAIPTPPPTPVPPFGSPSPYPTALSTPAKASSPPRVDATSVLLTDMDTAQVLLAKRRNTRLPIASLTKIMTAILVLKQTRPSARVQVSAAAASQDGSVLGLTAGERLRVRDLLYGLLLQSSNDAAVALAEHVAGTVGRFVALMNRMAKRMGLTRTRFRSPNGLDDRGYSTASDVATMTRAAYRLPVFSRITRTKSYDVAASSGVQRHVQNRNVLLWLYPGAFGVKTGFTSAAGYCLVATARRDGRRVLVVVLGNPEAAFDDAAALLNFGFAGFEHRTIAREGEGLGDLRIGGREVAAVAAESVTLLFRRGDSDRVRRRFRPAPGLSLPVDAGDTIGQAVFFSGGRRIGTVDAVAATSVSSEAAETDVSPFSPLRHLRGVVRVLSVLLRAAFGGP